MYSWYFGFSWSDVCTAGSMYSWYFRFSWSDVNVCTAGLDPHALPVDQCLDRDALPVVAC